VIGALAGCAGGDERSGARPDEIRWLERLAAWQQQTGDAGADADEIYLAILGGDDRLQGRIDEVLRPIRECSKRLREDVGDVPTARFEAGYALIRRACKQYEASADAFERSLSADDPSRALLEFDRANTEGAELMARAGRLIEARLSANRPLRRLGGNSEQSRVEPRFSRIGSELARKKVEVRCWSESEWPRVVGEWGAYVGTTDIGAFAQPSSDRASLAPETCRALVDFTYEHERPERGDALDEVAYAVGVLAHESEHSLSPAANEAETECYGMQEIRRVARFLGADASYASRLATRYWFEIYPSEPADYRSGECVDGRSLDDSPNSSVWP
jgi:tetratricopeptide (TPR) repeat protein